MQLEELGLALGEGKLASRKRVLLLVYLHTCKTNKHRGVVVLAISTPQRQLATPLNREPKGRIQGHGENVLSLWTALKQRVWRTVNPLSIHHTWEFPPHGMQNLNLVVAHSL